MLEKVAIPPRGGNSQLATGRFLPENVGSFPWPAMFQIIFNELSAAELSELPKTLQLTLLSEFQLLPEDLDRLADGKGSFGRIERDGKKLFRYRASDYRIYFETCPQGVTVHRILHKNTLSDFLFRSKLPLAEDDQLGRTKGFWKLIDEGANSRQNP